MTPILSPFPSGGPVRAGERENNALLPASGTRNTAAASSKFPARVDDLSLSHRRETVEVRIRAGSWRAHLNFPNPGIVSTHNPAGTPFQSAFPSGADTGDRFDLLPGVGLRFKFSRLSKAPGSLFSALVKFCQEPTRGIANVFRSFLSAVRHERTKTQEGTRPHGTFYPQIWGRKANV